MKFHQNLPAILTLWRSPLYLSYAVGASPCQRPVQRLKYNYNFTITSITPEGVHLGGKFQIFTQCVVPTLDKWDNSHLWLTTLFQWIHRLESCEPFSLHTEIRTTLYQGHTPENSRVTTINCWHVMHSHLFVFFQALSDYTFYVTCALISVVSLLPVVAFRFYRSDVHPTLVDKARLLQKHSTSKSKREFKPFSGRRSRYN